MHEIQRPIVADKIASFARRSVSPEGTVFGHSTIADLVALKAGLRVSYGLADLAPRWLDMGIISRESVVEQIEADNVELFVSPNWFWTKDEWFRGYLERCYEKPVIFPREPGNGIPRMFVFVHKKEPKPCAP
jgi:hypothetical protein